MKTSSPSRPSATSWRRNSPPVAGHDVGQRLAHRGRERRAAAHVDERAAPALLDGPQQFPQPVRLGPDHVVDPAPLAGLDDVTLAVESDRRVGAGEGDGQLQPSRGCRRVQLRVPDEFLWCPDPQVEPVLAGPEPGSYGPGAVRAATKPRNGAIPDPAANITTGRASSAGSRNRGVSTICSDSRCRPSLLTRRRKCDAVPCRSRGYDHGVWAELYSRPATTRLSVVAAWPGGGAEAMEYRRNGSGVIIWQKAFALGLDQPSRAW